MKNKPQLISLSEEENQLLKIEASKLGISISAFVRLLLKQWSNGIRFEKDKNNGRTSNT